MTLDTTEILKLARRMVADRGAATVLEQLDELVADQVTDADDGALRLLTDDEA